MKHEAQVAVSDQDDGSLTRRGFVLAAGRGTAALGATGLIAGCGGASISSGSGNASAGGGTPVRGGTFNVGFVGAGSSEQLYPGAVTGIPDLFRVQQLYDNLFNLSADPPSGCSRPCPVGRTECRRDGVDVPVA